MKSELGPPMTLGHAAAARVRLIVWCKACPHQAEPDPAGMAQRYGAATSVLDWRARLVCSLCGSREIDMAHHERIFGLRLACARYAKGRLENRCLVGAQVATSKLNEGQQRDGRPLKDVFYMPGSTTIAETLSHVFAELEREIPTDGTRISLFQAWTKLFGGPNRSIIDVASGIGQVSTVLIKLRSQINTSIKLKDFQKRSALATLSEFEPLFDANRFHEGASNFSSHYNETKRGLLGIIGLSLESEFGEPRLEKPDADELINALNEVKELLTDSSIALDLRVSLTKYIDVMIWWLSHPEMASLQDLFETVGSAMVIARQMRDRDAGRDSSEPTASKGVYERIMGFATKMGELMGLGARGAEDFEKLTDAAQHILENLDPSG